MSQIDERLREITTGRILLVDDQPQNLKLLRAILEPIGYELSFATSGETALSILSEVKIDLILLDVMMPGHDGYQICQKIKQQNQTRDIPVIFVTARTDVAGLSQGFAAGAVDYIAKPVRRQELEARVATHIQLHTTLKSLKEEISQRITAEEKLQYLLQHDPLTGSVNKDEFEQRLSRVIKSAHKAEIYHALLFLDLDKFKQINDSCGHQAGDKLLQELTVLMRSNIRSRDTLARLGGDEFGVLLENCTEDDSMVTAEKIRSAIQGYVFTWKGQAYSVGVSIGIYSIDRNTTNAYDAMQFADSACLYSKNRGRNRVTQYNTTFTSGKKLSMHPCSVGDITSALAQNRFKLYRQPIFSGRNGTQQVMHVEILIRLQDENGVNLLPGAFLPVAHRYEKMPDIDQWVVAETLKWYTVHPDELDKIEAISINLSVDTVRNEPAMQTILMLVSDAPAIAEKICFEICESEVVNNIALLKDVIKDFRKLGVKFIIDNFNGGYASFHQIRDLNIDFVKVSGVVIENIDEDNIGRTMTKTINELSQQLGIKTIAGSTSSAAKLEHVKSMGFDYYQGYYLGMPEQLQ